MSNFLLTKKRDKKHSNVRNIVIVLIVFILSSAQAQNIEYFPPHLSNEQSLLKLRFRAKFNNFNPELSTTIQVHISSSPDQHFVVCAGSVEADGTAAVFPLSGNGLLYNSKSYQLITTEHQTLLKLTGSAACQPDMREGYPYHSLQVLYSESPFLVEWFQEKRKGARPQKQLQPNEVSHGVSGWPLLNPPLLNPTTEDTTLSVGGGYGFNDDDGQQRKRPPWIPFEGSEAFSLTLLPNLQLPEGVRNYLPDLRTYYALLDYLGYGDEQTLILRFAGQPPIKLPVSRSERQELAENMTSALQLLHWLAPKLNGREVLINELLNIQQGLVDEQKEESLPEAIKKQLAIVLEQDEGEFSLEFELNQWAEAIMNANFGTSDTAPLGIKPVYSRPEISCRARTCPIEKSQQQELSFKQKSEATGSGTQGGGASSKKTGKEEDQRQVQSSRNNDGQEIQSTGAESIAPTVTITFVGNNNSGKSALANMFLGFNHFHRQSTTTGELEQNYQHQGIRVRALPGYEKSIPEGYVKQYGIETEDIIVLVLNDDLSDKDFQLLREISASRDGNLYRVIIVQNKAEGLENDAARSAMSNGTDMNAELTRINVEIKRRIQRQLSATFNIDSTADSTAIPIVHTSAAYQSWDPINNLYLNIEEMVGSDDQNWNLFTREIRNTRQINSSVLKSLRDLDSLPEIFMSYIKIIIDAFEITEPVINQILINHFQTMNSIYKNTGYVDLYKMFATILGQIAVQETNRAESESVAHTYGGAFGGWLSGFRSMAFHPEAMERAIQYATHTVSLGQKEVVHIGPEGILIATGEGTVAYLAVRQTMGNSQASINHEAEGTTNIFGCSFNLKILESDLNRLMDALSNPAERLKILSPLLDSLAYFKFKKARSQFDTRQHSVDRLVEFCAVGDVESVTGMINTFGVSLLFDLHSESGDSALHAAVRNSETTTIQAIGHVIAENGGEKELLWQLLKNRNGETPRQLQEPDCKSCDRSKNTVHTSTGINKESSEAELLDAAASGNTERVQTLLAQGVSPSAMNDNKRTPLHLAAQHGHSELVGILLNLPLSDGPPYTPMHSAAEGGFIDIMELLIAHYGDINARSAYNLTAMHLAAAGGHVPAMKWLLNKGAEIVPSDKNDLTPMHRAAAGGHVSAMEWLLDKGAEIAPCDKYDQTPMHRAAAGGHVSVMEWLLDKGAEIAPCDVDDLTPIHLAAAGGHVSVMEWLLDKGAEIAPCDVDDLTPMHLAAEGGHVPAMEWLLDKGAEIAPCDKYDQTPMHRAAAGGHVPAMEWLLNKSAKIAPCDKDDLTLMYRAAEGGHVPAMEWLLARGVKIEPKVAPHWSWAPINNSCFSGHLEATRWLLDHGADINKGRHPYHAAARGGHINLMIWLKDHHCYPAKSHDGWTAMHAAAMGNQIGTMEWLLTQGESVDAKNSRGLTPLYAAAMVGNFDAMKWLAKKGADVMVSTKTGKTLMHAAAASGDVTIMEWLLSKGVDVGTLAKNRVTPLYAAVRGDDHTIVLKKTGNLDAMKWLLDHGADINSGKHPYDAALQGGHSEIIRWLETNNYRSKPDQNGWTPMHVAALHDQIPAMECLMELGYDMNAVSRNRLTPMGVAAKQGNLEATKWLYSHATNRRNTRHPFLLAAQNGHVEVMNWLERHGLRFHGTFENWTPMHAAALHGQIQAMMRLLELGDDVNAASNRGLTPMAAAAKRGHLNAIKWLYDHGAIYKRGTQHPFLLAAQNGHVKVMNWLEQHGLRFRRSDNNWTPMHAAAQHGQIQAMERLLELGDNVNAANDKGLTPMTEAAKRGHLNAMKWLYDHGAIYKRGTQHPFLLAE